MTDIAGPSTADYLGLANNSQPPNPLQTMQGWQNYANSQIQGQAQIQGIINARTQNDIAKQKLSVDRMNREGVAAASLIGSTNDPVEMEKKIRTLIADEQQSGTLDANTAAIRNAGVPSAMKPDGTTTSIDEYNDLLRRHAVSALSAQDALNAVRPQGQWMNIGGHMVFVTPPAQVSPVGTPPTSQATMDNTLSPQVGQRMDPNAGGPGVPGMVNTTIGGGYGNPPPANGGIRNGGGGSYAPNPLQGPIPQSMIPPAPGSRTMGSDGRPTNGPDPNKFIVGPDGQMWPTQIPGQGKPGGYPTVSQIPAPAQAPAGPNPWSTTVPIGAPENIAQNQQAYRSAQNEAAKLPLQNTQYMEAHDAIARLVKLGNLPTSGVGQSYLDTPRQILADMGFASYVPLVTDRATAEKYLSMAIASKAPASDARQSLLEHSNPTLQMPAGASLPIIRQIVGSNRAQQLAVDTAPDPTGNGFINHQKEQAKLYNSKEGLAALSYDLMPKAEQLKYIGADGKPGPALANQAAVSRFSQVLKLAHNDNLLNYTPSGGQ